MKGPLPALWGLLLGASVVISSAQARTLIVPADHSTIQAALDDAAAGDRIEIAPGTYYEYGLVMVSGVTLVGTGNSAQEVVLDAQGSGRILLCEGLDGSTLVDNLTFKRGHAQGQTAYDQSGGAILISNSSLRIQHCLFLNNEADASGGGIRCSHSSPLIARCRFEGNRAPGGGGGAVDCSYQSSPTILDCYFQDNLAAWGAALSCRGESTPQVTDCSFDANTADGTRAYGGAVFADYESMPDFQTCTFYGNQARYGGGLAFFTNAHSTLKECTLVENSVSIEGGGLFCVDSSPTISQSIIAFQQGTALSCFGEAQPQISCSNLFGNSRGDWVGCLIGQETRDGNLSVDPLFCALDPGLEFDFTLDPASACATGAAGCGIMGAWGVDCATLEAFLSDFHCEWDDLTPAIEWEVALSREMPVFRLTRTEASSPDETVIPYVETALGHYTAQDAALSAEPDQVFTYRLYLLDADQWALLKEFRMTAPDNAPYLRLAGAWPNPFNPQTRINFEVGRPQRIKVSIFDLEGNLVRSLADRTFSSGRQSVQWNGRTDGGKVAGSGTYVVLVMGRDARRTLKVTLLK